MKTFLKIFFGLLLAVGLFTFAFYRTPQERAFTKNSKLAQAGDATAALAVAQAYEKGEGTKPDNHRFGHNRHLQSTASSERLLRYPGRLQDGKTQLQSYSYRTDKSRFL